MLTKHNHLQFIKKHGKFQVDCSHAIFSTDEIDILEKYGHWFKALTIGTLEPITELQKEFVLVAKRKRSPFSLEETVWNKYLHRKELEADPENKLKLIYQYEEDTFYNRNMVRKQRSTMFRVMNENHK